MIYKNLSHATKTFYGVTFQPNDEHEVPGYINNPKFIRLNEFTQKSDEPPKTTDKTEEVQSAPIKKKSGRTRNLKEEVITDGTDSD